MRRGPYLIYSAQRLLTFRRLHYDAALRVRKGLILASCLVLVLLAAGGETLQAKTAAHKRSPSLDGTRLAATPQRHPDTLSPATLGEQYCRNIADEATEARAAFIAEQLKALGRTIDEKLAILTSRTAELKEWVAKREAFANTATTQLVSIYTAMRPESASEQLGKVDETIAAAILSRLEPKVASMILNEMPAERAARLASLLAVASRKRDDGSVN